MTEKVLRAVAAALKINADEWVATLKDGDEFLPEETVLEEISKAVSERVAAAKLQSRKSGQAEQNAQVRKFVKSQGFDNPDNLQGEELLSAFMAWKEDSAPPPPMGDGLKLEDVGVETLRKLPNVKSLIVEAQQGAGQKFAALQKQLEEKAAEFDAYKRGEEERKVRHVARQHFAKALKEGGIILSPEGVDVDPEERIDSAFERMWGRRKIGLDANGAPIVLNDDGSAPDADEFGNPVRFDDVAVAVAKPMYGVSKQDARQGGSGIHPGQNGTPPSAQGRMRFNNQAELDAYLTSETNPALRAAANRAWQQQQTEKMAAGN